MNLNEFEKEERKKIIDNRKQISSHRQQLEELKEQNRKNNYNEQHKKLFIKPEGQFDQDGFEHRVKAYNARRQKSLGRLQREEEERNRYKFAPTLNEKTLELTKHQPSFETKIKRDLERAKSSALLRKKEKAEQSKSRSRTPNGTTRNKNTSEFSKQMKTKELEEQSRKFFADNLEWKRQLDEKIFVEQVSQNLVKEALPSFKPKLNHKKNDELVKTTFVERIRVQDQIVQEKVDDLSKQIYNHTFTPRLFKNN